MHHMQFTRNTLLAGTAVISMTLSLYAISYAKSFAATYLLNQNFENGTASGACIGNCPTVSTARARSGTHSLQVKLNPATNSNPESTRMDFGPLFQKGGEYWIGLSTYLDQGYTTSFGQSVVFQFEPTSGTARSPFLLQYHVSGSTETEEIHNELNLEFNQKFKLTSRSVQKGTWIDWVIHVRMDGPANGFYEVWRNGTKVLSFKGGTYSNTWSGPVKFVVGTYRSLENNNHSKPNITRTTYIDDVRVIGAGGSYKDVAPSGAKPTSDGSTLGGSPSGATYCRRYTATDPVPEGFGASYDLFFSLNTVFMKVLCAPKEAQFEVGTGDPNMFIWDTAYVWRGNAWKQVSLSGQSKTGQWYRGTANASAPFTAALTTPGTVDYFIAYVCQYANDTWKCGCSSKTHCGLWNLQQFVW